MSKFPHGKRFAFTIFDDTDDSTLERVEPVYRFLADLGLYTTKSVWPLAGLAEGRIGGATLEEDQGYRKFTLWLQSKGFEIALHNVRNYDATREVIQQGIEQFHRVVGNFPRVHCNHDVNRDNLYWGSSRLDNPIAAFVYNLATRFKYLKYFQGHVESSSYFWGDLCRQHISYVRNFVFDEINLERINPSMPYHDPRKPFVTYWFSSSEGGNVESFCRMLREENQDRLEAEEGICIMYTHFGKGFYSDGCLNPAFERVMRRLANKNGWFVPVSRLLDHLRENGRGLDIPALELRRMELVWLKEKLINGTS